MAMAESRDALDGIFCHFLPSRVEPESTPPAHRLEWTEALRATIIGLERAIRPVEYLAGTRRFEFHAVWSIAEFSSTQCGHLAALGLRRPMETHLDTHAQRGKDS